jgi:hypothetical protein
MSDTTPTRPRTRVERDGNRWQARYFDPAMRLWFDLGDPRDTEAEARELARTWVFDHDMRPCGHSPHQCPAPGCCTACGHQLEWDGSGGYRHTLTTPTRTTTRGTSR